MRTLIGLLLLSLSSFAQVQVNDYEIPSNTTDRNNLNQFVMPNVTGITVPLNWSVIDNCSNTGPCTPGNYGWCSAPS